MTLTLALPPFPYSHSLATWLSFLILSEYLAFYPGSALFKTLASLSFFLGGLGQGSAAYQIPSSISSLLDTQAFRDDERYRFTVFMIFGLGFSVLGDVFLIPSKAEYYSFLRVHAPQSASKSPSKKSKKSSKTVSANDGEESDSLRFKLGMFFFALAHLSYIGGFASNPARASFRWVSFALSVAVSLGISTWLGIFWSNSSAGGSQLTVPIDMQPLVKGYCLIITTMVAVATATDAGTQKMLGAWLFMISDMFVAVDVFGSKRLGVVGSGNGKSSRSGWAFRSVGWIFYFGANLILAGSI